MFEKTSKNEICERKNIENVDSLIDRYSMYDKTLMNENCERKKNVEIVDSFVD